MCLKPLLLLLLIFVYSVENVQIKIQNSNAQNLTVFEKGLCDKKATKNDILNNHNSYYSYNNDSRIMKQILGFVDISDDNSYLEATRFVHKFAMLSPYKIEIKRTGSLNYEISGLGLIRLTKKWAQDLTKSKQELAVLPLLTFPDWTTSDIFSLITSYAEITKLSTELLNTCESYNIDGLILDIWSGFYGKMPTSSIVLIIQEICARLRLSFRRVLILVPSMYANSDVITTESFQIMADFANHVILDMYDYSSEWTPGPNSPPRLEIEEFIKYLTPDPLEKRSTIIIGINFFGNVFTNSGKRKITKEEYIELLELFENDDLEFDEESQEHFFEINKEDEKMTIYYPTLFSIHSKVRLANKLGVGLAISKIGDGLRYFYDVL